MKPEDAIEQIGFFDDISRDARQRLASEASLARHSPDDLLYEPGDAAEDLFALMEGTVDLSLDFRKSVLLARPGFEEAIQVTHEFFDKPLVVGRVDPGRVFGWSAFCGTGRRVLSARCRIESRTLRLPAAHLQTVFEKDPELGYRLTSRLSRLLFRHLDIRTRYLVEAWGQAFGTDRIQPEAL